VSGPSPQRILVLDNDYGTADFVGAIARQIGCETFTSTEPHEALALASAHRPDLIALDIGYRSMSGEDFVLQLSDAGVNAPLLVMSASPRAAEIGARMGAARIVTKPFDAREMAEALTELLRTEPSRS
jgi:DNA-binding response OmpR family regulator